MDEPSTGPAPFTAPMTISTTYGRIGWARGTCPMSARRRLQHASVSHKRRRMDLPWSTRFALRAVARFHALMDGYRECGVDSAGW
nr:hypothetical protein JVH1_4324 [Rhodococcus sp. JVH1]